MKRITALFLALITLFGLAACAKEDAQPTKETEEEEKYTETLEIFMDKETGEDTYEYPTISEPLSWEAVNRLPKKTKDMTEDELREMCVEFFRYNKTAVWTPDDTITFNRYKDSGEDTVEKGKLYGGLPYVSTATGSIYRLLDYTDENGVVDIKNASKVIKLFGAQCSVSAYWAWARCINSVDYSWTYSSVVANGFLRVGPYTYDDSIKMFSAENSTRKICDTNGKEIMFQSYAQMKPADGMVYYIGGGHTAMCSSKPVVVYNDDGTINGKESYIYFIDQGGTWTERTTEFGEVTQVKGAYDWKMDFEYMFKCAYVPFTFAEFQGTDPVEETECSFSHTGDTISVDELKAGKVNANYGISDIYAVLCSKTGKEVNLAVVSATRASKHELSFEGAFEEVDLDLYASGKYTVKIVCQLGTGERPTVYEGTLVK